MKKAIYFLLVTLFITGGCAREDNTVRIRIKNASNFDFENVYVNTGGAENTYGDLSAGQVTEYKEFVSAYRYAYIRLVVNGHMATLQPIDYVGETHLTGGKYTYEITTDGNSEYLGLEFKEN